MELSMEFLYNLLFERGITQSLFLLTITIALGIFLAEKLKIGRFSLGVTWILFTGIVLSHFGMMLDPQVERFAKDFGLVLFVYSIGLQVGPSFFSSFGKGGLKLNMLATCVVLLGVLTAFCIHWATGEDMVAMVGILCGAVTNTPGMGAAQQALSDVTGQLNNDIASGYAIAYPLGVVGVLLTIMLLRLLLRVNYKEEEERIRAEENDGGQPTCIDILVDNPRVDGKNVTQIQDILGIQMVVSRVFTMGGQEEVANSDTVIHTGDTMRVLVDKHSVPTIELIGQETHKHPEDISTKGLVSKRIVVTKETMNGRKIGSLAIRKNYRVNITRVNRAGIDLLATPELVLQLGDRLIVVGDEEDIRKVADIFGNELKRLDIPNLMPIFLGIALGIMVGTIPFVIPGLSQPFKLGLAGGSLIVAILIGRFGPYYHLVTFATTSANKMIREIGISLFLATVGLGAGNTFFQTVMDGGYWWILYGVLITMIPLLLVGLIGRLWLKLDFFSLTGMLSGSMTDPPALAYASALAGDNDKPSVAYATVYPFTMFLRVLSAQLIILLFCV